MRVVMFTHSLLTDRSRGNARFLRGERSAASGERSEEVLP